MVPDSKMLLGLPSASNKISGHPERPQGGERTLLSLLAPGPQQLCSVSAPQSPAVTGPSARLPGPYLASIFTLCRMPCLPPTVAGVLAPRGLGDRSTCHNPQLCNQETCPSPAGCLGKPSHIAFGCIQEKQESLVDLSSPLSLMLSRCGVFPKLANVFPSDLCLTQTAS